MGFEKNIYDYSLSQMGRTVKNDTISDELFKKYMVNRGLRETANSGIEAIRWRG